jgi:hypothetical protein
MSYLSLGIGPHEGSNGNMNTNLPRNKLVEALRNAPRRMREKLDSLKRMGEDLSNRPDLIWHMLLQSMSGMGNNRGYARLILNDTNYRMVAWATVEALPKSERLAHIHSALAAAAVRMPGRKARWLTDYFDKIEQMGGISKALEQMRSLKGREGKLPFFQLFAGIKDKYGRNIWMDLCDPDFRDAVAIDVRLKKMYAVLGIPTDDYARAEQAMLEIAREAGLTGWGLDRLLFHFSDHFLSVLGAAAMSVDAGNEPEEETHTYIKDGSIMTDSGQHIEPLPHDVNSAVPKWEAMYADFLKRRNTSSLAGKAKYAQKLIHRFNGCVPLATIVDATQRKALCKELFNESNDFNYVTYVLGMGIYLGALRRDGEYLVVVRPELL